MAHFAEIDPENVVIRVVVVDNADLTGPDGQESEAMGKSFLRKLLGGRWVQCSYNANFRGIYPGPGCLYDEAADVFKTADDTPPTIS